MHARYLGPLAALLVLGGCATSQDLVVLLPDKDGKVGKVFVHNRKGDVTLDSAYAAARTSGSGVKRDTASRDEVKNVFGSALTAMPPRPVSFTLYFESGTDEFTEQSKQEVKRVIAEMARRQAPEITVIGHTDQVGPDPTNDALSLQRADRVKSILVGMGIPPERIMTAGRGRREPLVRTAEGVSEPRNRRVEISVR
jgi:outer membrane protein OmpA-like peptidoglycan-associated protein